jgi:hypothetical protein
MPAVARDTIQKQEFVLYKKWYILSLFILAFCLELFSAEGGDYYNLLNLQGVTVCPIIK